MPTREDLKNLIEQIEACQDRNERAVLYRKYDEMEKELKKQEV